MNLHEKLKQDTQIALKSKDSVRLSVLRLLLSAITNGLVALGRKPNETMSDDDINTVIAKEAKKRKDSIEQFIKGGRNDLAEAEKSELKILFEFLPKELSDDEIQIIINTKISELDISDKSKLGVLMGAVMKDVKNRADGNRVRELIEKTLSS